MSRPSFGRTCHIVIVRPERQFIRYFIFRNCGFIRSIAVYGIGGYLLAVDSPVTLIPLFYGNLGKSSDSRTSRYGHFSSFVKNYIFELNNRLFGSVGVLNYKSIGVDCRGKRGSIGRPFVSRRNPIFYQFPTATFIKNVKFTTSAYFFIFDRNAVSFPRRKIYAVAVCNIARRREIDGYQIATLRNTVRSTATAPPTVHRLGDRFSLVRFERQSVRFRGCPYRTYARRNKRRPYECEKASNEYY